jgi:hypothetical protein
MEDCAAELLNLAHEYSHPDNDFDLQALLVYDRQISEPRQGWHGRVDDTQEAKDGIPLALSVFAISLYRGIGIPQKKADGLSALKPAYSRGCCLAEDQLRAIGVAENTDLNLGELVRQPPHRPSLHFAVSHGH